MDTTCERCQELEESLRVANQISQTQQHTADYWFAKVEMIRYILNCRADEFYEIREFVANKTEA